MEPFGTRAAGSGSTGKLHLLLRESVKDLLALQVPLVAVAQLELLQHNGDNQVEHHEAGQDEAEAEKQRGRLQGILSAA